MRARRATKKELAYGKKAREYLSKVAELPCCVCGLRPVQVHHKRTGVGMSMKAPYFETMPLCYNHHQGRDGIHTVGVKRWQDINGPESDFVIMTQERLNWLNKQ